MPFIPSEVNVGNGVLYIEVADKALPTPPTGAPTPSGASPGDLLGKLESVGDAAGKACVHLFEKLEAALGEVRPNEVTVEFSITLGGEAGVPFVAKGSAEAAFSISATWTLS
jgi:hypothetical protein